ncbi:MAG: tRNA (adenosine(37)-N6)-threonylcarbamoyltransferase complex transferase subunit TsaD [Bacilli bacterium]|nr:tRNA (adenosine(37)-N6)-threonylcarbamoyltransferase complex transferase subunit TsaD [Bacilli bacterium]
MKDIYILAVETSCDETSLAIVKNGREVVALEVYTQMDTHALYGGVVPEIASRMHTEAITLVLDSLLKKSSFDINDIDAVAVTYAPGLMGGLLVGIEFAKTISYIYNKPLIKVNHMVGHIYANNIENRLKFPLLAMVVSGGHTELVEMNNDYDFKLLGSTMDDAIGEAYDKVARILNVPYPGGPNVERLARDGNVSYQLAKPVNDNTLNFSYSGLKSNVINFVHNCHQRGENININDLAASFQYYAVDEITRKIDIALSKKKYKMVVLAGGVSANQYLRCEVEKVTSKYNVELAVPRMLYCTDNAAMIGAAAYPLYVENKGIADLSLNALSHISTVE